MRVVTSIGRIWFHAVGCGSMEQRPFAGRTVPVIGMGTSQTFDVAAVDDVRQAVTDAALDGGATFVDSSPMYGNAERILGATIAARRQEAIVATKVWTYDDEEAERQIDASLGFFGGHVEVFQVHNLRSWPTRLDQLEARRDKGQLDIVAATHWKPSEFGELETVMRTGRIGAVQVPYNPREREVEQRIFPLAQELGIGVILMRPFAAGGLVGRSPDAAELAPLAAFGVTSWPQALLKYGLSHPATSVTIPATTRPERMTENTAAGDGPWFDADAKALVERLAGR
jgi:aryl-alcohol dehydrogenase-like predicted oxidoreductase